MLADSRVTLHGHPSLTDIAALVVIIVIEFAGLYTVLKTTEDPGWKEVLLVAIFGVRSFDSKPPPTRVCPNARTHGSKMKSA